jgi:hypothetical protein
MKVIFNSIYAMQVLLILLKNELPVNYIPILL